MRWWVKKTRVFQQDTRGKCPYGKGLTPGPRMQKIANHTEVFKKHLG